MMSTFNKHNLSDLIDRYPVYTHDSGWNYEICAKNGHTLNYRIHSGIVGNRWVKDQETYIVRTRESIYKISWAEPTGTDVSLIVSLDDKLFHGTIFFPHWIVNNPKKTACFQNDHVLLVSSYRSAGPAYPAEVIDEFVAITLIRDCGADNDEVINYPASELPAGFPANL